ncbi:MAG: putative acyl-CoA dehydrogenase, partial [Acidimicrobiia bacterium]|nr:putative acyl-CoA dehydrogenase [Acidimicrobiia bacterium]
MPADSAAAPFDPEAFRQRVRKFLADNAPDLPFRTGTRSPENLEEAQMLRAWSAQIYAENLYGADWPVEFGGNPHWIADEDFIVSEEFARSRAPVPIGAGGLAAWAFIAFGTEEQKRRYLPRIRTYEDVWCQLF